jgi:hypothetical protein
LFTNADKQADETANTLTKAVFVSGPEEVVNGRTREAVANAALIDFVGGL